MRTCCKYLHPKDYPLLSLSRLYLQSGARNIIPLIVHITHFLFLQKHLTSETELILIGWKIIPNESL